MGAGQSAESSRAQRLEEALKREQETVARLEAAVCREREATAKLRRNWQYALGGGGGFLLVGSIAAAFMVRRRMKGVVDAVELQWKTLHDASMRDARRRADAEMQSTKKFAVEALARDLLPVADCLEYAQRHARQTPGSAAGHAAQGGGDSGGGAAAITEGIALTEQSLLATLLKHGIEKQDPLGKEFDPNLHEAVRRLEDSPAAPGCVADVHRSGYMINDRVLRAAQVAVVVAAQESASAAQSAASERATPSPDEADGDRAAGGGAGCGEGAGSGAGSAKGSAP